MEIKKRREERGTGRRKNKEGIKKEKWREKREK